MPGTKYFRPHNWKFGKCVRCVALPVAIPHVSTSYENDMWLTAPSLEQCARIQFRCFRCGKGEGDEAKLRRIRIETEQEQARAAIHVHSDR